MIKAVLLDLDNTLLINPDRAFAQAFLSRIDEHFATSFGHQHISRTIRQIIQTLSKHQNGSDTNTAVALNLLQEATGQKPEAIQQVLKSFYDIIYPTLQVHVDVQPDTAALVQFLHDTGYQIVIATNPIYPEVGIRRRMQWAGLPDDDSLYDLVTTSDNMHFAKPDPAYYAEILATIGVEPENAIMVGDSLDNDIHPATQVGLHTYCVAVDEIIADGTLSDFFTCVKQPDWRKSFVAKERVQEMITPVLRGHIGAFNGLLRDVEPEMWQSQSAPNECSLLQWVCHLADIETLRHQADLTRFFKNDLQQIRPIQPPNPKTPASSDDGPTMIRRFITARQNTLKLLKNHADNLPNDQQLTLLDVAYPIIQHDRHCFRQIKQLRNNTIQTE